MRNGQVSDGQQLQNDFPRVSACLISWKRPHHLPTIIASLRECDFIDEILVWNNNPELRLEINDPFTRVINSDANAMCYARYLCAAEARNQIIYVQDDDAVNHDISGLYAEFLADPHRVAHALLPSHFEQATRQTYGSAQNALLGWGAFFRRDWISVFNQLSASALDDPLLPREADKIFTIMLDRRHNSLLGHVSLLNGHSDDGVALWRDPSQPTNASLGIRLALSQLRLRKTPDAPATWNVVIPCHNYGMYLPEAIESVLANDADYEIQVVDDASDDDTAQVAAHYTSQYSHVRYLRNEIQRGPAHSQNRGIKASSGPYVVLLDADDCIGPDYLWEAEQRLQAGADVVNPDAILFGAAQGRWPVPEVTTLEMLLKRNSVHNCSAFRRHLWRQVGGIDEQMPRWMDHEFWIRVAAQNARIEGLHGDHYFYRRHEDSLSRSSAPRSWRRSMDWTAEESV